MAHALSIETFVTRCFPAEISTVTAWFWREIQIPEGRYY